MVKPKRATAGIIMAEGWPPRILMALRSDVLRFMPGHYVFPGGRIDHDEGMANVIGARDLEHGEQLHACVREIFEETGVLATRGPAPDPALAREARVALLAETRSIDDILETFGHTIHAEDFHPAGHWVTPPISPIRFDTQYFIYRVPEPVGGELIEGEHVALDWLEPHDARRQWRRGDLTLPTPVAHTLLELGRKAFPECLPVLQRIDDPTDGVPERIELACGVQIIPLQTETLPPATHTNCVLIGEDSVLIVDPGPSNPVEQEKLKRLLDELQDMGVEFMAIVLTHAHPDHIGAVTLVRDTYNVPVWAHSVTADRVDFGVDRHLEEGEVISVPGDPEFRVRCLHTPGHDPGHLCFHEETSGTVIGGDLVANPGTIVVSPDHLGDMTHYLDSLKRIRDLEHEMLVPAHGMALRDPKEKLQETIDHRLWREDKVRDALEQGHATMRDLLAAVYDDVPEATWPLAEHSLKAHLLRLGADIR